MSFLIVYLYITYRTAPCTYFHFSSQEYFKPMNRELANTLVAKILITVINTLAEIRWDVTKIRFLFYTNTVLLVIT